MIGDATCVIEPEYRHTCTFNRIIGCDGDHFVISFSETGAWIAIPAARLDFWDRLRFVAFHEDQITRFQLCDNIREVRLRPFAHDGPTLLRHDRNLLCSGSPMTRTVGAFIVEAKRVMGVLDRCETQSTTRELFDEPHGKRCLARIFPTDNSNNRRNYWGSRFTVRSGINCVWHEHLTFDQPARFFELVRRVGVIKRVNRRRSDPLISKVDGHCTVAVSPAQDLANAVCA